MKSKETNNKKETKVIPLADRVLVRPMTEEMLRQRGMDKPKLDFILPDSVTKEKSAQGKVLAVGPGKLVLGKIVPVSVKAGDVVIFSKYGYDEVELNGEELYLLKEDNILAILK